jgi:hypothetical protein
METNPIFCYSSGNPDTLVMLEDHHKLINLILTNP